jgi:hypothetical protein
MNSVEEKLNFVDKKLVHKVKDENVHIYNMRRALPREIDVTTFEVDILPHLTAEEEKFVMNFYVKREGQEGQAYILRTIPYKLPKERADKYLKDAEAKPEDIQYLEEFYQLNEAEGKYILQKPITESDEAKILSILDLRDLHITDYEKYQLYEIFEKLEKAEKKNIFFGNMHIDQTHYYFFEHPQEHVPGMMLLEAGRQFLIAVCHEFGNVPHNEVFMLTKMDSTFQSYVELNYPVKLRGKPTEVKVNKQGYWSYFRGPVTFYQKNKEVTTIEYEASIVPKNLFKRLRADKDKYDQLPRFRPISGVENNISLRDGSKRYLSSIIDISHQGFMLKFPDSEFMKRPDGVLDEAKSFEFFMFFDKVGFIHGNCDMKWSEPFGDDGYVAGFQIVKVNPIDIENLKEALKYYFRLKEEREIL